MNIQFPLGSQTSDPQHGVRDDAADVGLCHQTAQERGEPLRQGVQEARREVPYQGQEVPAGGHKGKSYKNQILHSIAIVKQ